MGQGSFEFKCGFFGYGLRSEIAENVAITEQQEAPNSVHHQLICIANIFIYFSQKCWAHSSAGGELNNLDKRFLLTFPAPHCQSNRSLPSLMNSGAERNGAQARKTRINLAALMQEVY